MAVTNKARVSGTVLFTNFNKEIMPRANGFVPFSATVWYRTMRAHSGLSG